MKLSTCLLLPCLLVPVLSPWQQEEPKVVRPAPVRPFQREGERLSKAVPGSWMLFEYADPREAPQTDQATGFATFQDGFLTLFLAIDTAESRLFHLRERLLFRSGAYRYRFDPNGSLQLANVMSFTTQTENGQLQREPPGEVLEYFASIDDDVLELRNTDGVRLSFRRVTSVEFPASAIRKLESRRGGDSHWEVEPEPR